MKVVVAPDSFKGCLSAAQAAAAVAEGVLGVCANVQVDVCPMADGGEGTVAAMVSATGGRMLAADVFDPLGAPIRAHFGLLGDQMAAALPGELGLAAAEVLAEGQGRAVIGPGGSTAVVEMAAASGLALIGPEHRDPTRTTTYGTGQLILAALDEGAGTIILGVGGSATVDGGCGCAQALGVTFCGADGEPMVCGLAGGGLKLVRDVDTAGVDPRIAEASIRVACDVTNPLTGPNGAAAVYGPQKGATEEMIAELDAGLAHLAGLVRDKFGLDMEAIPGGGAAGGLAAGLVAFAGGDIERGVDVVAAAVRLPRRLSGAALCITGEGRLDTQSAAGKTTAGVARYARQAGVPVICIPGSLADDAPVHLFDRVMPLAQSPDRTDQAKWDAHALLKALAAEAIKDFLAG